MLKKQKTHKEGKRKGGKKHAFFKTDKKDTMHLSVEQRVDAILTQNAPTHPPHNETPSETKRKFFFFKEKIHPRKTKLLSPKNKRKTHEVRPVKTKTLRKPKETKPLHLKNMHRLQDVKLFFVKHKPKRHVSKKIQATSEKTPQAKPKSIDHPTPQTAAPSPPEPVSQGSTEQNKEKEPVNQFPEYLPDINPDEASWIDQKVKEQLTAQSEHPDGTASLQPPDASEGKRKKTLKEQFHPITFKSKKTKREPPVETLPPENQPRTPAQATVNPELMAPTRKETHANNIEGLSPDGLVQYQTIAQTLKNQTLSQLGYEKEAIEEIDFYPLQEPYAYVQIVREQDSLDKRYILVEVQLTNEENKLLNFLKTSFTSIPFHTTQIEDIGGKQYLNQKVDEILADYMVPATQEIKDKLIYFLEKDFLGLGKLEILMKDSNIEDISCDGVNIPIFLYHRRFGSLQSNVQFIEEDRTLQPS